MTNVRDKVVIITGSSMGIGKTLAKKLGVNHAKIVINGRSEEKLVATAKELQEIGCEVLSICGDIAREDDCKKLIRETLDYYGKIDILVNNAAISMRGEFEKLSSLVISSVFQINTIAPFILTQMALPHIKKTKGSIVFISSLSGFGGLPYISAYSASKMPLTAMADALRVEHHRDAIHIGIVYVGPTEIDKDKKIMKENGDPMVLEGMQGFIYNRKEEVAQKIARNISHRKKQTIVGYLGKFYAIMIRFSPRLTKFIIIRFQNKFQKYFKQDLSHFRS